MAHIAVFDNTLTLLGKKNALVLLMDWGVGLGIIMDGKVRKWGALLLR